ncbi:MAG TPA: penicillin-binding protein 2 [Bellilinea sp.]|nr:penicillin-binding protein 2 [Bellilinea sp.]
MNRRVNNVRLKWVGWAFTLLGAAILIQIINVQNSPQAKKMISYLEKTYNQEVRVISPERGNIYDRWGNLLAGNVEVFEVGIAPNQVVNSDTVAQDLSAVLGLDYTNIKSIARSYVESGNLQYQVVADFVTADKIQELEARLEKYIAMPAPKEGVGPSLNGVHWVPHLRRTYPENATASNVLGFVNFHDRMDSRGILGVEEKYNSLLAGNQTKIVIPMNPTEIQTIPSVPPGSSLILTIDRSIQAAMERIAAEAQKANDADSVTIIVEDPKTGDLLAMASTPSFNPNEYQKYGEIFPVGSYFNRPVSQLYEPGSVYKVLTMAAALDSGSVTPETVFNDTGLITVGGAAVQNWDRQAYGEQTMTGCMQYSLNVCMTWLAINMGPTTFYDYMQRFNIGRYSGVDVAGEAVYPLLMPGDSSWYEVNLATNSFGQGVAVTPLQMTAAISAVANDGKIMTPRVVKSYIQDGVQYDIAPRMIRQAIKPETARELTEMLAQSLENEASDALVEGYRVSGKTGTAEIPSPEGYISGLTNASFVGWGPSDDPQFIVYIWLEKPRSSIWGSVVAAPVFSQVVYELVDLMKIPPDNIRHQLANQ